MSNIQTRQLLPFKNQQKKNNRSWVDRLTDGIIFPGMVMLWRVVREEGIGCGEGEKSRKWNQDIRGYELKNTILICSDSLAHKD